MPPPSGPRRPFVPSSQLQHFMQDRTASTAGLRGATPAPVQQLYRRLDGVTPGSDCGAHAGSGASSSAPSTLATPSLTVSSLVRTTSITSSDASPTSPASDVSLSQLGPRLDPDTHEVTRPLPLGCVLSFVDCDERFSSYVDWRQHTYVHFLQGRRGLPPRINTCTFCDWTLEAARDDDRWAAWDAKLWHLYQYHQLELAQPQMPRDTKFLVVLYKLGVVNQATYQAMIQGGRAYTHGENGNRNARSRRDGLR